MIERGVTPLMAPAELKELGFALIVWPVGPLYSAAMALKDYYTNLREQGTGEALMDRLLPFDEFHQIVGLEEKYALDEKYRT